MYKLILLALLIPSAAAQSGFDLSISVEPNATLQPPGIERAMTVSWTISCAGPVPYTGLEGGGLINLELAIPANVTVAGADSHVTALPDCVQTTSTSDEAKFNIAATEQVPAFVANSFGIAATLSWPQLQQTETATDETQYDFFVDYFGLMEARVPFTLQEGAPGTVTPYEVQISNFGNAPTQYRFEFSDPAMKGSAVWPAEPLAAGEQAVAVINFEHGTGSGWVNREDAVTIIITPFSADDESKEGPATSINVVARTRGGAVDTPGLGLPLIVAIVGAAALAARRKD